MAAPGKDTVEGLVARKSYAKALELIGAQLERRPRDDRLRLQQADVLIASGREKEAVTHLMALADEQAADGFAAKAIAILKRIEKIAPGRQDVEDRLAHLIQEKVRHAPGVSRASAAASAEFGLEEFDPDAELPVVPPPEAGALPAGVAATADADDLEGLDYIAAAEPEPAPAEQRPAFVSTPLFEGFSQEELVAVIRGLKLLTFAPGDILVAEGGPGDSLFILASGSVKAFVRNPKGNYIKVNELGEGAFFGEIAVLTGKPRTATITAASPCEVLELDRTALDTITASHPRVREILKKFHEQRAQDTVQAMIRKRE
jgi:cyclic nucleotide-binding protein